MINFADATHDELEHLTFVCEPATFGLDDEDVYDETYRRAGKLDVDYFASMIDTNTSGLIAAIKYDLLEGREQNVEAELYKLNVYGACNVRSASTA